MKDEEWIARLNDDMYVLMSLCIIQFLRIVLSDINAITYIASEQIQLSMKIFCTSSNMSFLSRFQPFTRKPYQYEPTLHQSTNYGHLPYGNRFFRHEYVDKFVVPKVIFYAYSWMQEVNSLHSLKFQSIQNAMKALSAWDPV